MKYYVENIQRGNVGNCMLWWKIGGHGYGCNLKKAQVFDENDPSLASIRNSGKYKLWEKNYIDSIAILHVDSQDVDSTHSA
jgi:hypothetical protein